MTLCPCPDVPGPHDPTSWGGGGSREGTGAYRSDGQPHLQVAEHNDTEWDDAARDHEDDHV